MRPLESSNVIVFSSNAASGRILSAETVTSSENKNL